MSQTIVVGYDGSEESRGAVEFARRVATTVGSPLHVVVAATDPLADVVATRAGIDPSVWHARLLKETDRSARASLTTLLEAEPSLVELAVQIGRPEHVLFEYAGEHDAALVVVGEHSRDVAGVRTRGTAAHLLRRLSIPVLVAPPEPGTIERVLAALESASAGRPVVEVARRFAHDLGARIEYLHVIDERAIRAAGRHGWSDPARELTLRAETEIWSLLDPEEARSIETGPVDATISRIAAEEPGTLLVVGSHGKGWIERMLLGSTTEAMLFDPPCALLVVPIMASGKQSPRADASKDDQIE